MLNRQCSDTVSNIVLIATREVTLWSPDKKNDLTPSVVTGQMQVTSTSHEYEKSKAKTNATPAQANV
ncbi:hypothetical protein J6590_082552 [Homalodisca vitripennis]|nr:hypothetical protein J6590_096969 [Homalodisca vitripennis]KAG8285323.1 hypothetical protein J6590_082552 [Homalodisca vitripennis]